MTAERKGGHVLNDCRTKRRRRKKRSLSPSAEKKVRAPHCRCRSLIVFSRLLRVAFLSEWRGCVSEPGDPGGEISRTRFPFSPSAGGGRVVSSLCPWVTWQTDRRQTGGAREAQWGGRRSIIHGRSGEERVVLSNWVDLLKYLYFTCIHILI